MECDYRKASRSSWGKPAVEIHVTKEDLTLGAMLRIADAAEKMAVNHIQLTNDRDMYQRLYQEQWQRRKKLERSNAALRGVIKRMKQRKDGE